MYNDLAIKSHDCYQNTQNEMTCHFQQMTHLLKWEFLQDFLLNNLPFSYTIWWVAKGGIKRRKLLLKLLIEDLKVDFRALRGNAYRTVFVGACICRNGFSSTELTKKKFAIFHFSCENTLWLWIFGYWKTMFKELSLGPSVRNDNAVVSTHLGLQQSGDSFTYDHLVGGRVRTTYHRICEYAY